MWYLWKARNDHRFHRKTWTPWQVHHAVAAHILAHRQAQEENNADIAMQPATQQGAPSQVDRYTVQVPAILPGIRCYVDASTQPDQTSRSPRLAGLGILFVNTQVQPAQTIYTKAKVTGIQSVIMAEAATLALAALIND